MGMIGRWATVGLTRWGEIQWCGFRCAVYRTSATAGGWINHDHFSLGLALLRLGLWLGPSQGSGVRLAPPTNAMAIINSSHGAGAGQNFDLLLVL